LLSFGSASDLRRLINTDFSDKTVSCVTHRRGIPAGNYLRKLGITGQK